MAKEKTWARQDLKRNELAEWLASAVRWIILHREIALAGALTLVVGSAIVAYLVFHARRLDDQAWHQLSIAQGLAGQRQEEQAMKLLNDFASRFQATSAYPHALLTKADLLVSQKKPQEVIQLYETLLGMREAKPLYPVVYSALGATQEDRHRPTEAQRAYRTFLEKFSDHFLAPRVYESSARVEETLGNPQAARTLYETLSTRYPNTSWAERAQERLTALPLPLPQVFPSTSAVTGSQTVPLGEMQNPTSNLR